MKSSMPTCSSASWGGLTIWRPKFLEIPLGRSFSHVQLKERLFMETWKERIKTKTSLTTLHFGDSVWRISGMGRQSGKQRCLGLTASYPATPQTHPKCLSSSSSSPCLSLSSISHQVLLPINRDICHQARNLRRFDLFSRLSHHHFQAQPVLRGCWTTWNHLHTESTGRYWGLNSLTLHTQLSLLGNYHDVFVRLVDVFKITKWTVPFHLKVHPSQFSFISQQKRGGGWKHNTHKLIQHGWFQTTISMENRDFISVDM